MSVEDRPRLRLQRRLRSRNLPLADNQTQLNDVERLWSLRLLVEGGYHKRLLGSGGFRCDGSAMALGLDVWEEEGQYAPAQVLGHLRTTLRAINRQTALPSLPPVLAANLLALGEDLGLTALDQALLGFAVLLDQDAPFRRITDLVKPIDEQRLPAVLGCALHADPAEVAERLAPGAPLHVTGLLEIFEPGSELGDMLCLLSSRMARRLCRGPVSPSDLLGNVLTRAPAPELGLEDYSHLEGDLSVLLPWLQAVRASGRAGCNVLVYGPPGTGKTQFSRVLAQALGCHAYEVACRDGEGDVLDGPARLRAYRSAQALLGQQSTALLVFDELEDAFDEVTDGLLRRRRSCSKAWIHRMLETNAAPTLWIGNAVGALDEALLRRFDYVLAIPVPSQPLRERILQRYCGDRVDAATLQRLSQSPALSPAIVSRAARVIEEVGPALDPRSRGSALERLLDNTLTVQGRGRVASHIARGGDASGLGGYELEFLNADIDLAGLAEGVRQAGQARICLYGPPGTGKSGFGRWLARQIGRPLQVHRVSDLVSKYVGETEQAIARAFEEAEASQAVLVFDEVDSFLASRDGSRQHWEITQVNEMLTQMEAFSGVFVASTNVLEVVEAAALRRFDLKVGLQPLRAPQAMALFDRVCAQLSLQPQKAEREAVGRLGSLTPGDFAAVVRRARFAPLGDAAALRQALAAEVRLKRPHARPVGFRLNALD